jgi:hypothetical protein
MAEAIRRSHFLISIAVLVMAVCAPLPAAAQTTQSQGDPRILMALSDSLVMCEGDTRFARIEVAWNSDQAGPSDSPPDLRFSSATDSIVSVKPNSEITARKAGIQPIIATVAWGNFSARREFLVTVLPGRRDIKASKAKGQTVCGKN